MKETLRSVTEHVDAQPTLDMRSTYDALWTLLGELRAKIDAVLELTPDASSEPVHSYGAPGGPQGELRTFTGPEVDWMVHSWVGQPELSFSNMHLTVWLGPHTKVPHLGIAAGTIPNLWCYLDLIPRADLWTDLEHLDRYYEPRNDEWLAFREATDLTWFTSRSLYIREALSQTAFVYMGEPSSEQVGVVRDKAHELVDTWISHLRTGDPVPEHDRAALAERDLIVRQTIAERDPANVMGVRFFGAELTDRLVRTLWGGDRVNPRP